MAAKRTLDEEPVRLLLTGLVRSGRFFYRADPVTGLHTLFPARLELIKLGMSQEPAARLLREGVASGLIRETKINFELEAELKRVARESKAHGGDGDEDDRPARREPDEVERPFAPVKAGRYELVKESSRNGDFFGVYDSKLDHQYILGREKAAALAEIERRYNQDDYCRQSMLGRFNVK